MGAGGFGQFSKPKVTSFMDSPLFSVSNGVVAYFGELFVSSPNYTLLLKPIRGVRFALSLLDYLIPCIYFTLASANDLDN